VPDYALGRGHLRDGVWRDFNAEIAGRDGGDFGERQRLSTELHHLSPE